MRVAKFLNGKNISLATLNLACTFLNLNELEISTNISDEKANLLESTINSSAFDRWLILKLQIDEIEKKSRISALYYLKKSSREVESETLAERIVHVVECEIRSIRYSNSAKVGVSKVLQSDLTYIEKVKLLKSQFPFALSKPQFNHLHKRRKKSELGGFADSDSGKIDLSLDPNSEEAIMNALKTGDGDSYGL